MYVCYDFDGKHPTIHFLDERCSIYSTPSIADTVWLFALICTYAGAFLHYKKTQTGFSRQKKYKTKLIAYSSWYSNQVDSSHKSQRCICPTAAQYYKAFSCALTLPPLWITAGNLFTLVHVTSLVRQPASPPNETWFTATFRTLQTHLGQSMQGQLMPYNVTTTAALTSVWATQIDTHVITVSF